MEVSGQSHTLAALRPRKVPVLPIYWEAEWTPELVWTSRGRDKCLLVHTEILAALHLYCVEV